MYSPLRPFEVILLPVRVQPSDLVMAIPDWLFDPTVLPVRVLPLALFR